MNMSMGPTKNGPYNRSLSEVIYPLIDRWLRPRKKRTATSKKSLDLLALKVGFRFESGFTEARNSLYVRGGAQRKKEAERKEKEDANAILRTAAAEDKTGEAVELS